MGKNNFFCRSLDKNTHSRACVRPSIVADCRGQRKGIYSSFVAAAHNDLKVTGGGTNIKKKYVLSVWRETQGEIETKGRQVGR